MDAETRSPAKTVSSFRAIAAWGPGLLVMLADADAGNVVTAAQSGAQWGYRLLPLLLALIPLLYMTQELAVRLGIFTSRGHGELVRDILGRRWASLSVAVLVVSSIGTLITEFTAVAGIGELYGLPRSLTLPPAAIALLAVVLSGSCRRAERIAIVIGSAQMAFFFVAWRSHPDPQTVVRDALAMPLGNRHFLYLAAALVGAVFNPWMIYYQQSALAERKLMPRDYRVARWDTACGSVLTQLLTAAVLIAGAALRAPGAPAALGSVGEISQALTSVLGKAAGQMVFSLGVLGAALVAAIVSSLALAWGLGEIAGYRRSLELRPFKARWFWPTYAVCVCGSAGLVWLFPDLVGLNIASQVLNALLLPVVIGVLIALAATALPSPLRLQGWYGRAVITMAVAVCALGLIGGLAQLL